MNDVDVCYTHLAEVIIKLMIKDYTSVCDRLVNKKYRQGSSRYADIQTYILCRDSILKGCNGLAPDYGEDFLKKINKHYKINQTQIETIIRTYLYPEGKK